MRPREEDAFWEEGCIRGRVHEEGGGLHEDRREAAEEEAVYIHSPLSINTLSSHPEIHKLAKHLLT